MGAKVADRGQRRYQPTPKQKWSSIGTGSHPRVVQATATELAKHGPQIPGLGAHGAFQDKMHAGLATRSDQAEQEVHEVQLSAGVAPIPILEPHEVVRGQAGH